MTTLLFDGRETALTGADGLWIRGSDLEAATGWTLEPKGVCHGRACVPLPGGAASSWLDGDRFDVAAFAAHTRRPVVRAGDVWSVGPEPGARLGAGPAPDFTLPDLDGRLHALSDYRGRKVLLHAWASW